jgi:hypothetical protein
VLDADGNFANADGGAGGVSQRPDQVGDPNRAGIVPGSPNPQCQVLASQGGLAPDRIHTPTSWFNTCAFADPPLGSFGDVGRNTDRGTGIQKLGLFSIQVLPHLGEGRIWNFARSSSISRTTPISCSRLADRKMETTRPFSGRNSSAI